MEFKAQLLLPSDLRWEQVKSTFSVFQSSNLCLGNKHLVYCSRGDEWNDSRTIIKLNSDAHRGSQRRNQTNGCRRSGSTFGWTGQGQKAARICPNSKNQSRPRKFSCQYNVANLYPSMQSSPGYRNSSALQSRSWQIEVRSDHLHKSEYFSNQKRPNPLRGISRCGLHRSRSWYCQAESDSAGLNRTWSNNLHPV